MTGRITTGTLGESALRQGEETTRCSKCGQTSGNHYEGCPRATKAHALICYRCKGRVPADAAVNVLGHFLHVRCAREVAGEINRTLDRREGVIRE